MTALSFALPATIAAITPADETWRARARERLSNLTMPTWAMGRVMDLALDVAGMTRSLAPRLDRRAVVVMAGDHGVTAEGVSPYPSEVTVQMMRNFIAKGAGINAVAGVVDTDVLVVDMGVAGDVSDLAAAGRIISSPIAKGTANLAKTTAMTREQAVASLEAGIALAGRLAPDYDLFGLGEMGIGNTTPSSAITAVFCNELPERVTGRGTGVDDSGLRRKISVIQAALDLHVPDPSDPVGVLAAVGGFEIGGLAGLILGAAAAKKPVLIDGFITTAAALLAQALAPEASDYMIAAHRSVEPGHILALEKLRLEPLLDLGLRLGEGTGAALAMPLVLAARAVLTEVASFDEAGVATAANSCIC